MGLLCKFGFHSWTACKCTVCGKVRDEDHVWVGCKCTVCGKVRDEGHHLCKCTVCGKVRDEDHLWDGCKCTVCGKVREGRINVPYEGHSWDGCRCSVCGKIRKIRDEGHSWDGCRCSVCGKIKGALVPLKYIIVFGEIGGMTMHKALLEQLKRGEWDALLKTTDGRRLLCERLEDPLVPGSGGYDSALEMTSMLALRNLLRANSIDVVPALRGALFFEELWGSKYSIRYYIKDAESGAGKTAKESLCQNPGPTSDDLAWMKYYLKKFQQVAEHWKSVIAARMGTEPGRTNLIPLTFHLDDEVWLRQRLDGVTAFFIEERHEAAIQELKCRECGHIQAKGEWEENMQKMTREAGLGTWRNITQQAECLACSSTNLIPIFDS